MKDLNNKFESVVDIKEIERKVSSFVEGLRKSLDIEAELRDALNKVKESKFNLEKEYKEICGCIEKELRVNLDQLGEKKLESCKLEAELKEEESKGSHPFCSIYAKVPPLNENISDSRFDEFMTKYKESVRLSQEISQIDLSVKSLLGLQKALDDRYSNVMIIDYLINRLGDLINNHKFVKTPQLQASYIQKFGHFKVVQKLVDDKNNEIQKNQQAIDRTFEEFSVSKRFGDSVDKKITESELASEIFDK